MQFMPKTRGIVNDYILNSRLNLLFEKLWYFRKSLLYGKADDQQEEVINTVEFDLQIMLGRFSHYQPWVTDHSLPLD